MGVGGVMPWLRFTPGKGPPSTHWIEEWVGLRAGLDTEARGKILCLWGLNPSHPVCSQTL
jgi:hypothetical protein